MRRLAIVLASKGWILRSGGAPGADTAFEIDAPADRRRIYIPWNGFSDHSHNQEGYVDPYRIVSRDVYEQARQIAARHHPGWMNMKESIRKLMARNVFQVLGDDLNTPSKFVWCWAPGTRLEDGKIADVKGGTGLAVRVAKEFGVSVYNMDYAPHMAVLEKYLLEQETAIVPPQLTPSRRI